MLLSTLDRKKSGDPAAIILINKEQVASLMKAKDLKKIHGIMKKEQKHHNLLSVFFVYCKMPTKIYKLKYKVLHGVMSMNYYRMTQIQPRRNNQKYKKTFQK